MAVASLVLLSLVACISRGVDSPASPEPPVLAPARIAEILASPDRNQTDRTNDFLRNQADPRDRNTPDPPQPKDEFVLKFVKR